MLKAKGAENYGIHAFLASNTVTNDYYPKLARISLNLPCAWSARPAHVAFINLSGGVGIPYLPEQQANDIHAIGEGVRSLQRDSGPRRHGRCGDLHRDGSLYDGPLRMPGHKAIHEKQIYKDYIGVDASAVDLIRPAMYGAYHHYGDGPSWVATTRPQRPSRTPTTSRAICARTTTSSPSIASCRIST